MERGIIKKMKGYICCYFCNKKLELPKRNFYKFLFKNGFFVVKIYNDEIEEEFYVCRECYFKKFYLPIESYKEIVECKNC